jgi:hypothetical protein
MNIFAAIEDTRLKNSFRVPVLLWNVKNAAAAKLKNNFRFLPLLQLLRQAVVRLLTAALPPAAADVTANAAADIEVSNE